MANGRANDGQARSSGLRRWLPVGVIAVAMTVAIAMGWHRALSFENLANQHDALRAFVKNHLLLGVLIYAGIYIACVALSLPGGLVLTIAGGMLFGVWLATPVTVVAATVGATLVFLVAKSSFGAALAERAGPWLDRFRDGFEREGLSYMLFLRLVPFPFFVINIAPAVLGVPLRTFVVGTLLGIIPGTFAFTFLGATLDRVVVDAKSAYDACVAAKGVGSCRLSVELGQLPIRQILAALTLIGMIALIPPALKKWRARNAAV